MQALKSQHKILSLILAVMLVIGTIPVVASASEDNANSLGKSPAATPGTTTTALYNPDDIAVINSIINENGLGLTLADPADGSYVPDDWFERASGFGNTSTVVTWSSDESNKRIIELYIGNRSLSGILDVSDLDQLEILRCSYNPITGLDTSGMYKLKYLEVSGTQIAEINLTDLRELEALRCQETEILSLDLSSLTQLEELYCGFNQLTELELTGLTELRKIHCAYNPLGELDLSDQVNLISIWCVNNNLTELDLSSLINLEMLDCTRNQLTELDLSNLKKVTELHCSQNQITKLDVTGLPLTYLNCQYNLMQSKDDVIGLAENVEFWFNPQNTSGSSPDPNPATPPTVYPSGSDNDDRGSSSSGGSSSSSSVPTGPANVTTAAATTAVNSVLAAAKASGADSATARLVNPGNITLATLQAMVRQAGTTPLKLQADSMNADGRTIDVRITLDPKLATKNLNLSASTTNAAAKAAETIFEKFFSNNVSVVSLGQKGSFGQPVEIAAKIDPALDTANLVFYSYDKSTNSYKLIPNSGYWVDKNGYVHFTTTLGGNIIISDGALAKR